MGSERDGWIHDIPWVSGGLDTQLDVIDEEDGLIKDNSRLLA